MSSSPSKQFSLSKHARERLNERSTLTESQLLDLLQHNAFRRIHSTRISSISQNEIELYTKEYGLSFEEMRRYGIVRTRVTFKHLMVWSISDSRPLTLIVESDSGTIITVLYSDDFSSNDWSDKVTEASVSDAREKAERLFFSNVNVYLLHLRWLDEGGMPKFKTFNSPKITSVLPLIPSMEDLIRIARAHVLNGRDVWLSVRNRKDPSDIVLERFLDEKESLI